MDRTFVGFHRYNVQATSFVGARESIKSIYNKKRSLLRLITDHNRAYSAAISAGHKN